MGLYWDFKHGDPIDFGYFNIKDIMKISPREIDPLKPVLI